MRKTEMAKNLMITLEMLKAKDACDEKVIKFKEIFGDKVVLNAINIKKAAVELGGSHTWAARRFLKEPNNALEFMTFSRNSDKEWQETCNKEGNGCVGMRASRCKELGAEHNIRCWTKFVELYRKENKAPRKSRAKVADRDLKRA